MTTSNLAMLRDLEFSRLAATNTVYLDYTGAALYPESLVVNDSRRLRTQVLGNPHSGSAPSQASTEAMERARHLTLRLLDADPREYDVVFTGNATGAIRILAEAFPFRHGSRLVPTADNHNSVNGLRLPVRRRSATVAHVPLDSELRSVDPLEYLPSTATPSLFAYPAQSNFSGVQHPLTWIAEAQRRGYHVLLDAAAFLATNQLSLTAHPADFVALSFYKLFGYPTGVGALVARREALAMLRKSRSYSGGGTVQFVSLQNNLSRLKFGAEGFEDGTPNFLSMPAVCDGLDWLNRIGIAAIHNHVSALTEELLHRLQSVNAIVYGPRDSTARGGAIAFNLKHHDRVIPFEAVERAARKCGIAIRGGCFCNPGAAEAAFAMPASGTRNCLRGGPFTIARFRSCLGGDQAVGALRASLGIANTRSDIDAISRFLMELAEVATEGRVTNRVPTKGAFVSSSQSPAV